eukprot:TRINITY_DN17603_c0_g1_i1.p1 TRINITY_DN17603_c0_g1~~TRINITY_DN17603_c0_g1_i1.p1  ORF type:complete len:154 (-),score=43.93 TRINITY_DN17603_c0_g1_i1:230-691(-)
MSTHEDSDTAASSFESGNPLQDTMTLPDLSGTVSEAALAMAMSATGLRGRRGNSRTHEGDGEVSSELSSTPTSPSPFAPSSSHFVTPSSPTSHEIAEMSMEDMMQLCRQLLTRMTESSASSTESHLRRYDSLVKIQHTAEKVYTALLAADQDA